jgi:hypothetical protein
MKKSFALLMVILITFGLYAQAPQKMSYQAVIRNSSNTLIASSPVGMRISILQGSSTGTEVYKEIYNPNPQTNANGLVTIEIGGGIPLTGTFSTIDWTSGSFFLMTEIDPTGGTNYTISGTSQLLSVPFAIYAKTSGTSADAVKTTGDQNISGNKTFINTTSVAAPVNDNDAVNKVYVDNLIAAFQSVINALIGGKTLCGNVYRDLQTDVANCGGCGTVCASGYKCVNGICVIDCQAGWVSCGGIRCIDLQNDRANCGFCGAACAVGYHCSNGQCVPD